MIHYLIDTDCAVYAMLGEYPDLRVRLMECQLGEVGISAISFAQIMLAEAQGKPPAMSKIDLFLSEVPVLPFDEAAGRAYAGLAFRRATVDRLIAAHALSIGAATVTKNESDFSDIAALKVENWTR